MTARVDAIWFVTRRAPAYALVLAAYVCVVLALPDRWAGGAFGGIGAGLGGFVIREVAWSRERRSVRAAAPAGLTAAQREQAWVASGAGPLPGEPQVRREALRLVDWRASSIASTPWRRLLVMGGVVLALVVAGSIWSRWWWGSAAALAVLSALAGRNVATLAGRRSELRAAVTGRPVDPHDLDLHRAEPDEALRLARTTPGYGVLQLIPRAPWGSASGQVLRVTIDGRPVTALWVPHAYVILAGRHRVSAATSWMGEVGLAGMTVEVPAGETLVVHYSPPAVSFLGGRMALAPQRRPGARALGIVSVSLVAILVAVIVLG